MTTATARRRLRRLCSLVALGLALTSTGALLQGCARRARVVYVTEAPPAPRREVRPASPSPRAVWIAGHWSWNGRRYVWIPGHWERNPRGANWVPGHWAKRPRGWVWVPGHWR